MVGVDYAFDCIGVKATMEQIVAAIRPGVLGGERGGTAVLVGVPQTTVELPAVEMLTGEKRFVASLGGSCSPDEDFPTFLEWTPAVTSTASRAIGATTSMKGVAALAAGKTPVAPSSSAPTCRRRTSNIETLFRC
jgi:Zn-dependent alcohol dehydrogenase